MTKTMAQLAAEKRAKRDKRRYIRMTMDGASCISEPDEVKDILTGDDMAGCTLTEVWMTQQQYEDLPEFSGW